MKKTSLCLSATIAVLSAPTLFAADAIYVSPSGDNQNPGTQAQPIRTLIHAHDLVRAMNQNLTSDITVWLGDGTYRLAEPLTLDAQDSGTSGHDVIYAALDGAHPVISGSVQVIGWKLADAGNNLWSAPAPAGLENTRQLYVNGVRARRTKGRLPVKLTETKTGYTADSPVMAHWRNPGDIEFVYTGGNAFWSERSWGLGAWTEPRCPVAGIEDTTITMAQPCWDNSTKRVMLPADSSFKRPANLVGPASIGKQPEYVENAYELLGTPGQWYFDRAAKMIYYTPRPGEDLATADVEAPRLEKLISGTGTEDSPIHNIIFKGLQFSGATWLLPSSNEGFSEIQANYLVTGAEGYATQGLGDLAPGGKRPFGAWTKTPGNISFSYDHGIQFLGDDFVHLGGAGLELGDGSQSNTVEGCVFTDISANGLELGGVDLPEGDAGQVTRDNRIANNHIYNVAAEYHGGVGIDVGYAQRTTIAHNQLDHLPYSGISLGWGGWPDKIKRAGVANNSCDNLVENNLIFDHMQLLADGGGIYTQGLTGPSLAKGEKLIGNVIYNQLGSGHGIYTDNGCNNVTARHNVIFHTNHDNWGGRHRNYYEGNGQANDYFVFEDNYWQQGDRDASAENVTLKNNRLISKLDQAPAEILQSAGLQPVFKGILQAQFGNPSAPEPPDRVAVSAGNGFAIVSWNPSVFDGGAPVESYTVISSGGEKITIPIAKFDAEGYAKIPGLENHVDYTFTVTANNVNGNSAPSLPSESITLNSGMIQPPGAPAAVSALAGDGMASIHFGPPADSGGGPVTAYVVTVNPGGRKVTLAGRKVLVLGGPHMTFDVVDGLENGKPYTFEVAAVNAAGIGGPAETRAITPTTYEAVK